MNTLTMEDIDRNITERMNAEGTQPDMLICHVDTWRNVVRREIETMEACIAWIGSRVKRCDPDNARRLGVFRTMREGLDKELREIKGALQKSYMPNNWKV